MDYGDFLHVSVWMETHTRTSKNNNESLTFGFNSAAEQAIVELVRFRLHLLTHSATGLSSGVAPSLPGQLHAGSRRMNLGFIFGATHVAQGLPPL